MDGAFRNWKANFTAVKAKRYHAGTACRYGRGFGGGGQQLGNRNFPNKRILRTTHASCLQ